MRTTTTAHNSSRRHDPQPVVTGEQAIKSLLLALLASIVLFAFTAWLYAQVDPAFSTGFRAIV